MLGTAKHKKREIDPNELAAKVAADGNFSVEELSVWSGSSRSEIYEQIAAGRLRSMKVGRRRLIPASWAREWRESFMPRPAAERRAGARA